MEGQEATLLHLLCAMQQLHVCHEVVELLRSLDGGCLSEPSQQLLWCKCLASPLSAMFPCGSEYMRRLLKAVVLAAEADGAEVMDEIMELYTACLVSPAAPLVLPASMGLPAPPPAPPAGWSYKVFAYAPSQQPAAVTLSDLARLEAQLVARAPCNAAAQQQDPGVQQQGDEQQPEEQQGEQQQGQHHQQPEQAAAELGGSWGAGTSLGSSSSGVIALRVSNNLFEGGTGCHEWEAGFYLAEVVLSSPGRFAGRSCLELGAGCGMVGVALDRVGASAVVCTDGDTQSVFNCRYNLQLNGVPLQGLPVEPAPCGRLCFQAVPSAAAAGAEAAQQPGQQGVAAGRGVPSTMGAGGRTSRAECRELRWEEGAGQLAPDVVLAADVLYDPEVIPTLLDLLKQLLRQGTAARQHGIGTDCGSGTAEAAEAAEGSAAPAAAPAACEALIATTLRNAATLARFVEAAQRDEELVLEDVTKEAAEGRLGAGRLGGTASVGAPPAGSEGSIVPPGLCNPKIVPPGVRFLHHAALEGARERIVLHRLTLAG